MSFFPRQRSDGDLEALGLIPPSEVRNATTDLLTKEEQGAGLTNGPQRFRACPIWIGPSFGPPLLPQAYGFGIRVTEFRPEGGRTSCSY